MRVILAEADGLHVEIKTDAPYSPDVLDDVCKRARELLADASRDQAHLSTDTA
jgi:hypothetical protein